MPHMRGQKLAYATALNIEGGDYLVLKLSLILKPRYYIVNMTREHEQLSEYLILTEIKQLYCAWCKSVRPSDKQNILCITEIV